MNGISSLTYVGSSILAVAESSSSEAALWALVPHDKSKRAAEATNKILFIIIFNILIIKLIMELIISHNSNPNCSQINSFRLGMCNYIHKLINYRNSNIYSFEILEVSKALLRMSFQR